MDIAQYIQELFSRAAKEHRLKKEEAEKKYKLNTDLFNECKRKEISLKIIEKLLNDGASINTLRKEEYAISYAARDPNILKLFLDKGGIKQNALNQALYAACKFKNLESAKLLLEAGASVDYEFEYAFSNTMQNAVDTPEILQLFLEKGGIEEDLLNKALLRACQYKKIESVKMLLDYGVSVYAKPHSGPFAIDHATGDPQILKLFLDTGDVKEDLLNEALIHACYYPKTEIVQMLLNAGASVNAKEEYGLFAIARAAKHPEVLKLFLDKGGISSEAAKAAGITLPEQETTQQSDTLSAEYAYAAKVALQPENTENTGSPE